MAAPNNGYRVDYTDAALLRKRENSVRNPSAKARRSVP